MPLCRQVPLTATPTLLLCSILAFYSALPSIFSYMPLLVYMPYLAVYTLIDILYPFM